MTLMGDKQYAVAIRAFHAAERMGKSDDAAVIAAVRGAVAAVDYDALLERLAWVEWGRTHDGWDIKPELPDAEYFDDARESLGAIGFIELLP